MIAYCPAVYLISYFLLYVTIPCMYFICYRQRQKWIVESEWGRKFQWGFRGKDRLFTALSMIRYFLYLLS